MNATRSLAGQIALVTGAGRRIGRAIALALGRRGASVVVHFNRSRPEADAVCNELTELGSRGWPVQADLSDPGDLSDLLTRAAEIAGEVDVLINSASIFPAGRLADIEFDDVTRNMAVNAWAPLSLTRDLWRRCERDGRKASVVNLLDSRLVGGDPLHAAYFVSKVALAEFTRASALAFSPLLRVNAIAPGPILPPEGKGAEYLRLQVDQIPLRRYGGPESVAHATSYLCEADFVTGQTLFVDGGYHLQPTSAP